MFGGIVHVKDFCHPMLQAVGFVHVFVGMTICFFQVGEIRRKVNCKARIHGLNVAREKFLLSSLI